jgi:hypothetical protein
VGCFGFFGCEMLRCRARGSDAFLDVFWGFFAIGCDGFFFAVGCTLRFRAACAEPALIRRDSGPETDQAP